MTDCRKLYVAAKESVQAQVEVELADLAVSSDNDGLAPSAVSAEPALQTTPVCDATSDTSDNDGDGLIDCDDPDCGNIMTTNISNN